MITDIKGIISSGREVAYNAANKAMVLTYWHVGKRIVEQEQAGKERAKYGQALIEALADELTKEYGKSFSKRNLQYFRKFYLAFPDEQIVNTCVHNLNWSHFRALLRVSDQIRIMIKSTMICRNVWTSYMMKSLILRMPWKKSKQDYIISGRTKSQKIMFTSSFYSLISCMINLQIWKKRHF